ncbi:hypothetical protein HWV62_15357 [Athelia sp. TMB]|nr:hypothetical protein HWV62_15357 [Athelia sp. TMB]
MSMVMVKTEIIEQDLGIALRHPRHARKRPRLSDSGSTGGRNSTKLNRRVDIDLTHVDDPPSPSSSEGTLLADVREETTRLAARVAALEAKQADRCACSCAATTSASSGQALAALAEPVRDASLRAQVTARTLLSSPPHYHSVNVPTDIGCTVLTQISAILQADQSCAADSDTGAADCSTGANREAAPLAPQGDAHTFGNLKGKGPLPHHPIASDLAPQGPISSASSASPVPDPQSGPPALPSMAIDPAPARSPALEPRAMSKSKPASTCASPSPAPSLPLFALSDTLPAPALVGPAPPASAPAKPMFLRTPLSTRLTYATLTENPHWFLDAADFAGPGIALPPVLCPTIDGTSEGCNGTDGVEGGLKGHGAGKDDVGEDEVRFRCLFCRKSLTGGPEERKDVRARWGRHVTDQHGVALERTSAPKEKAQAGQGAAKEDDAISSGHSTPAPTTRPRGRGSMSIEELLAPTPAPSPPRTYPPDQGVRRAHTHTVIAPGPQKDAPASLSAPVRRAVPMHTPHVKLAPRRPEADEQPRKRRRTSQEEHAGKHDVTPSSLRIRLPAARGRGEGVGVGG